MPLLHSYVPLPPLFIQHFYSFQILGDPQNVDGINFLFTKQRGLFFVFTTRVRRSRCWSLHALCSPLMLQFNVSLAMGMELLNRLTKVFKDYIGGLTEEAMRKNFILIYELLDEMLVCSDDGCRGNPLL